MIRSILLTALRNIFRHRAFSALNLIGLSVAMSLSLLVILIIREQFTYDNFHNDSDRIYRVNTMALRTDGNREPYASVPFPLGTALLEDYTLTDDVVRINRSLRGDAIHGNVNVPVNGLFTDPSFLKVFNFPLAKGDAASALNEANNVVLTQETAERIFGKAEALGQTLTIGKFGEFHVTGVLEKQLGKTHLDFQLLASTAAIPVLEKEGLIMQATDDWTNYYMSYVYFKLKDGKTEEDVSKALSAISKKHYSGVKLEVRDAGYEFYIQPMNKITPGPMLSNQMGTGMPDILLIFLGVLVVVVMVMACFNFTNLTIAKSLSRAREIGVRKAIGAQRLQVFFQFAGESVVFALIALVISYFLMQLMKPAFMQLNIATEFATELKEDYVVYAGFLAFALLVGFFAGLIPAGYLSAFKPVEVLKSSGATLKLHSRQTLRKALIVAQFTLSVIFVIVVLVIYNQVDYMLKKDYGINEKDIMNIRLQGRDFDKLSTAAQSVPGVISTGGLSHPLGTWEDRSSDYKRNAGDEQFTMRDFIVDANYMRNIEATFLAGRNLSVTAVGSEGSEVILNEKALQMFQLKDPVSAIGESIYVNDTVMLEVVGVVEDFNFRPLSYEIGPVAFRNVKSEFQWLSMRITAGQEEGVRAIMADIWKRLDPVHPFEANMMDEQIDTAYQEAGFQDLLTIVAYVSFLAVTLACLGMIGMSMYATQTRVKEIGIRKVMGASSSQVTYLLSRSFLFMIIVALIIGVPLGYLLGEQYLTLYAYKIDVSPSILLCGIGMIVLLGVVCVGSQTWRAAEANPVQSLKYE
jgi:putative ABC transport system permease protein